MNSPRISQENLMLPAPVVGKRENAVLSGGVLGSLRGARGQASAGGIRTTTLVLQASATRVRPEHVPTDRRWRLQPTVLRRAGAPQTAPLCKRTAAFPASSLAPILTNCTASAAAALTATSWEEGKYQRCRRTQSATSKSPLLTKRARSRVPVKP